MDNRWIKAAIDQLNDDTITAYMNLFQGCADMSPEFAEKYRPAFVEFLEVSLELAKENPATWTLGDVRDRIPNNQWLLLMDEVIKPKPLPPVSEKVKKEFRSAVLRRLRKKHFH